MNIKKTTNFKNWLDEVTLNYTSQYQLDIVTDYRNYLANHNDRFTLEMYRKLEQIVKQTRLAKLDNNT